MSISRKAKDIALVSSLALLGILSALILAEIVVRLFLSTELKFPVQDRPAFYYYPEDYKRSEIFFPAKAPGSYRISIVGDSFTYGYRMQLDDTFPARLGRMLNLSSERRKVEVINCGVPGNATVHEVPVVRRSFEKGADLVILQVTLNDVQPRPFAAESEGLKRSFGKYRPSPALARLFSYWKSAGYVAERIHNHRSHAIYKSYFKGSFDDPKLWGQFERAINEMKESTTKNNSKLVAVIMPLFEFLDENTYPFRDLHSKIDVALAHSEIEHLDLLQTFMDIPEARLQVMPGIDSHPNEIAHRIAAEKIYTWLAKDGIIPPELKIKTKSKAQIQRVPEIK